MGEAVHGPKDAVRVRLRPRLRQTVVIDEPLGQVEEDQGSVGERQEQQELAIDLARLYI